MSCAFKICLLTVSGPMTPVLIGGTAKRLLAQDRCSEPRNESKGKRQDGIAPNILTDSEHVDPEHIWGDEGPVND
jgi:hypothetical protein